MFWLDTWTKRTCLNINEELRVLFHKQRCDISCISDARLDNTINYKEIKTAGYDAVRSDWNRNSQGTGVSIYLQNHIPCLPKADLVPTKVEEICLEIKNIKTKPFLILTWHRPLNSYISIFYDNLNYLQEKATDKTRDLVTTDDFICNLLAN